MERTVARLLEEKDHEVWTTGPDATVFEALEVMAARHVVPSLLLTMGEALRDPSERDYVRKVILLDRGSRETAVSDIMTSELLTVATTQPTADCMGLMTDHRIRLLPVVEDNRLIGIATLGS